MSPTHCRAHGQQNPTFTSLDQEGAGKAAKGWVGLSQGRVPADAREQQEDVWLTSSSGSAWWLGEWDPWPWWHKERVGHELSKMEPAFQLKQSWVEL